MEIITQLEDERITQSQDVPRSNRQYISAEKIRLLAQTKFKQSREGITYEDLVNDGSFKCVNFGQRAQDTLHYHKREGNLFTQGRTNPQQYFATEDDAEMAAIFREKNTHSDPTEGSSILPMPLQMGIILQEGMGLPLLTHLGIVGYRIFIMHS